MAQATATKRKDPTAALAAANVALQELEQQVAELAGKREAQLLAGATAAEIVSLEAEIRKHEHAAATERDRIRLLNIAAEQEAVARRAKEKASLIGRIEKKLADRDAAAQELQEHVKRCDTLFRKIVSLSRDADAGWPFQSHDRVALMLPAAAISTALTHEIFRVGARPRRFGGADRDPDAGLDYPGAKCPRLDLANLPEQVTPFAAVIKDAGAYASSVMRGKPTAPPVTTVAAPANDQTAPPERTEAQERLSKLLARQFSLANAGPAAESEYMSVVAEVAAVSAEIAAAKGAPQR
jgi:hypothetical protein